MAIPDRFSGAYANQYTYDGPKIYEESLRIKEASTPGKVLFGVEGAIVT